MLLLTWIVTCIVSLSVGVSCYVILNDKICDPGTRSLTPYTGIRFYKRNEFDLNTMKLGSNMMVAICHKGRNLINVFNKQHHNSININWNSTICVKLPNDNKKNALASTAWQQVEATVKASSQYNYEVSKVYNFDNNNDDDGNNNNSSSSSSSSSSRGRGRGGLLDAPKGGLDNDTIRCFRIARTERYHDRQLTVYRPYQQIGGVFRCRMEKDTYARLEQHYFNNTSTSTSTSTKSSKGSKVENQLQLIELRNFDCHVSEPIAPLHSENVYYQWLDAKIVPARAVQYSIPLLYTPHNKHIKQLSDLWDSSSPSSTGSSSASSLWQNRVVSKVSNSSAPWFENIDVNEQYHMDQDAEKDTNRANKDASTDEKISRSVTNWLNQINDLLAGVDPNNRSLQKKFKKLVDVSTTAVNPQLESFFHKKKWAKFMNFDATELAFHEDKGENNDKAKISEIKKLLTDTGTFKTMYSQLSTTDKFLLVAGKLSKQKYKKKLLQLWEW